MRRVFTNGCFDILHPGHISLLKQAREIGTELIVGLNSDSSVRSIKGPDRPIQSEESRKTILSSLRWVDEVIVFNELTPERLIREIKPDVLVKGGDWEPDQIVGADFVIANGGEVISLPLLAGQSSTSLIEKLTVNVENPILKGAGIIESSLEETKQALDRILSENMSSIYDCGNLLVETFKSGKKVLLFGNGGSSTDAQYIAAEFVGRHESESRSLPAIALTADYSSLTAIANNFESEKSLARQVQSLAAGGDCLVAISTSENSPDVIAAVMEGRKKGCKVICLTGAKGRKLAALGDQSILVPAERTARIREMHIVIGHIWSEIVDQAFSDRD